MTAARPYLLYAYGNPGRCDDGLGPALAARIEALELPLVTVECDYQLTVEDALIVAQHDLVVFADASVDASPPWSLVEIHAKSATTFSSHVCDAASIMATAREVWGCAPRSFQLGIRGYEFNSFGEQLSPRAEENLDSACEMLKEVFLGDGLAQLSRLSILKKRSEAAGSGRGEAHER